MCKKCSSFTFSPSKALPPACHLASDLNCTTGVFISSQYNNVVLLCQVLLIPRQKLPQKHSFSVAVTHPDTPIHSLQPPSLSY